MKSWSEVRLSFIEVLWKNRWSLHFIFMPLCWLYYLCHLIKFYLLSRPKKIDAKVICIGNINVGGSGKTPMVIAVHDYMRSIGRNPCIITRGYGANTRQNTPILVDKEQNTAVDVGDESMLLAAYGDTIVCENRYRAAEYAQSLGYDTVIMDDGLQNNTVHKDLSIIMVRPDSIGNGLLLPIGPLREPIRDATRRAGLVCFINEEDSLVKEATEEIPSFVLKEKLITDIEEGTEVILMTSVASPGKVVNTLESNNIHMMQHFAFQDHHNYTKAELERIISLAADMKVKIATTEKDMVKIPHELQSHFNLVRIELLLPANLYFMLKKLF